MPDGTPPPSPGDPEPGHSGAPGPPHASNAPGSPHASDTPGLPHASDTPGSPGSPGAASPAAPARAPGVSDRRRDSEDRRTERQMWLYLGYFLFGIHLVALIMIYAIRHHG